tara:strand:+ start:216 stop:635 length:420 start_codon:yes stop_codon:yes gene_type:complete
MARYSRNSKITKALLSADSNVKKAERTQFGLGMVAPRVVQEIDKLFKKRKQDKKVYKNVENWLKKSNLTEDIMMPSFNAFTRGDNVNVNYEGIEIPLTQLEQASYIKNPKVNELIKMLGLENNTFDQVAKLMEDKNGKR